MVVNGPNRIPQFFPMSVGSTTIYCWLNHDFQTQPIIGSSPFLYMMLSYLAPLNYHKLLEITINYHKLLEITRNYHKLPEITINYH